MLQPFFQAISWNMINLLLYKIILQIHQACLFLVVSKEFFGLSGALFSSIYFAISVTNFGFDYFLITYYQQYCRGISALKKLGRLFVLRLSFLALLVLLLLCCARSFDAIIFQQPWTEWFITLPVGLRITLLLVFIFESAKKSLDILAQMSFMQRSVTLLDISSLLIYITCVWGWYLWAGYISLYTIFIPMSITSALEAGMLAYTIYQHYHQSQDQQRTHSPALLPPAGTIALQLTVNYINQISKALFSPNFFIMLLAWKLGVRKAGYIKLYTDLIILLYMLLNRSFGLPSAALLSALSLKHRDNLSLLKNLFVKMLTWYLRLLVVAGGCLVSWLLYLMHRNPQADVWTYVILFVLICLIEYVVILYEKWYLTQHRASTLAMINASSTLCCLAILYFWPASLGSLILLPLLALRLCFLATIMYTTYKIWHIRPSGKLWPEDVT